MNYKPKLSYVQLKALRAAANAGGCFVDNFKARTWARLHECGFIFGGRDKENFPVKFITTTGRDYLELIDDDQNDYKPGGIYGPAITEVNS